MGPINVAMNAAGCQCSRVNNNQSSRLHVNLHAFPVDVRLKDIDLLQYLLIYCIVEYLKIKYVAPYFSVIKHIVLFHGATFPRPAS